MEFIVFQMFLQENSTRAADSFSSAHPPALHAKGITANNKLERNYDKTA